MMNYRSEIVIFHKDNFIDFNSEQIEDSDDESNKRMHIIKNLLGDNMCCICYNESIDDIKKDNLTITLCNKCSSCFCLKCLTKSYENMNKEVCPVCKKDMNIHTA